MSNASAKNPVKFIAAVPFRIQPFYVVVKWSLHINRATGD
jgi:hypothetical protein